MAGLNTFLKLSIGAVSVGSIWMISSEKKDKGILYALSYGRDVSDGNKRTSWDSNWDRRGSAKSTIKQDSSTENDSNDAKVEAKVLKPTAKRHLIFIRHGQYVHADKSEDKASIFIIVMWKLRFRYPV